MTCFRRDVLLGAVGASGIAGALWGTLREFSPSARPSVLVAGSLLHVAEALSGASVEAHGSAAIRQLLLADHRHPDAVALADPRLFAGLAERVTLFATNALVITYHPESEYAVALERDWPAAVADPGLALGRTDPDADPLGYRTVMALRLAERDHDLSASDVLASAQVFPEVNLLTVLERGQLDAAFTYRNMAVQRGLPYVGLPARIDFSTPDHAETYATVSYSLPDTTVRGAPIRYAATATTARGESWVTDLVTARDLLQTKGFTVPKAYPRHGYRPSVG